jgi:protein-histidine pros-kinase
MAELIMEKKELLESLGDDTQLLQEVIEKFLATCPERLMELQAAITARNLDQITRGSHSLRGSVSTFGAKSAVDAAATLESMGRQGKVAGVDEAFARLEHEMLLVRDALEELAKDAS